VVQEKSDAAAKELRAGCLALPDPEPLTVFDHVYSTPHSWLERQRSQYAAYLDSIGPDSIGGDKVGGER
jgi:pyruvate dehydrogenase E1 component alpha subunit